ncbi:MAG: hypothetical protein Q4G30_06830 [Actinomycetaceae bacterium]|nr:hypothetical protein [Actinomycetaceae bacterium]
MEKSTDLDQTHEDLRVAQETLNTQDEALGAQWNRTEGMVVLAEVTPAQVADFLKDQDIVACLEWYPATPHLLSITLACDADSRVAVIKKGALEPGLDLEELVLSLASTFKADVRIGQVAIDNYPQDTTPPVVDEEEQAASQVLRTVEITHMAAAAIPVRATAEGQTLHCMDYDDDRRLVLWQRGPEEPASKVAWSLTEVPVIELRWSPDEQTLRIWKAADEGSAAWDGHTWAMDSILLAGSKPQAIDPETKNLIASLVGRARLVDAIHEALGEVDAKAVITALETPGTVGFLAMCRAVRLPGEVIDFLKGNLPAEKLEDADVHEDKGMTHALGRSVDVILTDPAFSSSTYWSMYHKVAIENPWIVRIFAALQALAGGALVFKALKSQRMGGLGKFLTSVGGVVIILDAIGEVVVAKYLGTKESRRLEELEQRRASRLDS